VSTQSIEIKIGPLNKIEVLIDGNLFYRQTEEAITNIFHKKRMNKLAINDGFEDMHQFFKWFDTDFKGKIIHWTDLRY
jgi:predicted nucleotide-binding protein (sugar kinase/HSP70/actin superfamily)